jgi:hypothetical protein
MFLQGFGEVLTDIMTVNPELSGLSNASSILDTSNYTFHAVTYGKDAQGFNFHAHSVSTVNRVDGESDGTVSGYNDDHVIAINYTNAGTMVSSYPASASHNTFASTYISLPQYPAINHERLELSSTQTTPAVSFSAAGPDLGHYPNAWVDSTLSNAWTILGGFAPPSSAGKFCHLYNSAGTILASGVLSGIYNQNGVIDKDGYVTVSQVTGLNATLGATQGAALTGGPVIFSSHASGIQPSAGNTALAVVPQHGDGATLVLYGGVNHIGVYCLDLPAMLGSGITPPYSYNALNNNRIYKLVSKVSFLNNLLNHEDISTLSGLIDGLSEGQGLTNKGPTFVLKFNFL